MGVVVLHVFMSTLLYYFANLILYLSSNLMHVALAKMDSDIPDLVEQKSIAGEPFDYFPEPFFCLLFYTYTNMRHVRGC